MGISSAFMLANLFGIMLLCAMDFILLNGKWFSWMCHLSSSFVVLARCAAPSCVLMHYPSKLNGVMAYRSGL